MNTNEMTTHNTSIRIAASGATCRRADGVVRAEIAAAAREERQP